MMFAWPVGSARRPDDRTHGWSSSARRRRSARSPRSIAPRRATDPDSPGASLGGDRRLTFAELDRRSNQVGRRRSTRRGVATGRPRRATSARTRCEFFELLFGASKVGAVIVPVNWRLAPPEVAQVVDDVEASLLVVGARARRPAARLGRRRAGHGSASVVTLGVGRRGRRRRSTSTTSGSAPRRPTTRGTCPAPTTSPCSCTRRARRDGPRGRCSRNRNVWACCPPTARDWGFGSVSVNLVTLPNFHVGGVGWALVGLFVGASSIVLPEFDAAPCCGRSPTHGVTHAVFVPAVIAGAARRPRGSPGPTSARSRHRLRRRRRSPRPSWPRRWQRFGCRLHPGLRADRDRSAA